jgi:hypothetical protein
MQQTHNRVRASGSPTEVSWAFVSDSPLGSNSINAADALCSSSYAQNLQRSSPFVGVSRKKSRIKAQTFWELLRGGFSQRGRCSSKWLLPHWGSHRSIIRRAGN